jgi:hypothetical protein
MLILYLADKNEINRILISILLRISLEFNICKEIY